MSSPLSNKPSFNWGGIGNVRFDPGTHVYHYCDNKELTSVSRFIGRFKQPFDPDGLILQACAKKEGISPEELRCRWDKKRDDSCVRGSLFHLQLQQYVETGIIHDGPDTDIIKHFANIRFGGTLHSEVILWDVGFGIAGIADLVEDMKDKVVNVYDAKTNQKLDREGYKGQTMLPPLNHLQDCHISHYSLQLSMYAYMLELADWTIGNLAIFWVNSETRELEKIDIPYLKDEVEIMLALPSI